MSVKSEDPAEFMLELLARQGAAATSVSDGHVIMFTKDKLKELLESVEARGSDKCIIFIKHNTVN